MNGFSSKIREKLLVAAKGVHEHKREEIFGFRTLAEAVEDENIKNILIQICSEEEIVAGYWVERITELGGMIDNKSSLKSKILLKVMGVKGFFEWVLDEEEEMIKQVALQAELIQDIPQSEAWGRFASDEMRSLQRIKNEILGMDSWTFHGSSGARSVATIYSNFYGGLLGMLAFLTGLYGTGTNPSIIPVTGIATLFAGAVSSAGGGYQSLRSEMEVLVRENKRNRLSGKALDEESKQLLEFYYSEGYSKEDAEKLINSIKDTRPFSIEDAIDKLGLSPIVLGDPINNATTSGVTFAISSFIPLFPFLLVSIPFENAMIVSILLTLLGLFCIGAGKAIFSKRKWLQSGFEVMLFGAIASTITYIIGSIVSLL